MADLDVTAPAAGVDALKVLFLSHTAPNGVYQVGSHFYSRQLAVAGHRVLHVNSPASRVHQILRKRTINLTAGTSNRGLVVESPRLAWLSPMTLLPVGMGWQPSLHRSVANSVCTWLGGNPDVILVDEPRLWPVARRVGAPVVYRPTDIQTARGSARAEYNNVGRSVGVVATTPALLDSLGIRGRGGDVPTVVISNGVDFSRFSQHHERATQEKRRAVYVGAIDKRFDWDAVVNFASAASSMSVEIYGDVASSIPELPQNVSVMGRLDYNAVPSLLASSDIGLMPFTFSAESLGRSPMKLYEYLASGLHIIASRTPSLQSANLPGVFLYADAIDAAKQLDQIPSGRNTAGQAAARAMDWRSATAELEEFLYRALSAVADKSCGKTRT